MTCDQLAIVQCNKPMLWFTADQHFGHANIIRYCARPFRDVEHMETELIARYNARVAPDDEVIHVGDFSLDEREIARILPRLHGRHHLVVGNHDACHPYHRRYQRALKYYVVDSNINPPRLFDTVRSEMLVEDFLVHHMPYVGDSRHEARYLEWRPKDEGRWLLHGHVHDAWAKRDRMINVGVDVRGYAPISLDEVRAIRASR
jgi:calcineurin-like phosphoesterase family protein